MSGAVNFSVTAIDSTTKVFDGIQKRLDKMNKPIERLGKSFGALSKSSGLTALAKGTKELGDRATSVARSMGQIVEPLGVITGAASIAGLVRLTTVWANWGSNLKFTAQNIGITATALQTWQGGAQLAGSSAASLSAGMQALGQNMYDAIGGRAPQVVAAMQMLGIHWQNFNHTAKTTTDVLPQIADRIARLHDPYKQAAIATALFGSAGMDLLPFLRLGSAGIARYNALAAKYGVTSVAGANAANALRMSQVGLTLAVQGVGNALAEKLQPILGPIIDQMAGWLANNRQLIATDIAGWIKAFEGWIVTTTPKVEGIINKFGGWKAVARDLMIFMGASWLAGMLAPIVSITAALTKMIALSAVWLATPAGMAFLAAGAGALLVAGAYDEWVNPPAGIFGGPKGGRYGTTKDQKAVLAQGVGYLSSQGLTPIATSGVLGNAERESSLSPAAYSTDPRSGPHYGLYQWSEARRQQILGALHIDVAKAGAADQEKAVVWDLKTNYPSLYKQMQNAKTSGQASRLFNDQFEGSSDSFTGQLQRIGYANSIYDQITHPPGPDTSATDMANHFKNLLGQPSGEPVNIGSGQGSSLGDHQGSQESRVTVDINHNNAPPGSTVTAKSDNPAVKTGTLKVSRSMLVPW